ncbi:hypothetical protein V7V80_17080 [Pseudomonas kermanshahensis]|uniref:Lipoprotein n=1 Tax=Pseudomonas kermanshahensis TaxID=2745482 RepID=A0ABU8R941_9PSED
MSAFKWSVALCTVTVLAFGCAYAETTPQSSNTVKISFANDKDQNPGKSCTKEFSWSTKKQIHLKDMACGNDQVYYFKVENFPSAALLWLADDPDCGSGGNFFFIVKGTKHPLGTEWMKIEKLDESDVGDQVKPGLRLERKVVRGKIDGKLSCFGYEY